MFDAEFLPVWEYAVLRAHIWFRVYALGLTSSDLSSGNCSQILTEYWI